MSLFDLCCHLDITLKEYNKLRETKPELTAKIDTWLAQALFKALLSKKINDRIFLFMIEQMGLQPKEESGNVIVQLTMPEKVRYD